jgi:hypothetical protein
LVPFSQRYKTPVSFPNRGDERRRIERMMSRCITWFPIGVLGEPNIYHDLGVFYKNWGFYLEELGQGCRII